MARLCRGFRWRRWNGSYNGVNVMDGVYVWRVSVQDPNTAEIYNFVGHVTVLR